MWVPFVLFCELFAQYLEHYLKVFSKEGLMLTSIPQCVHFLVILIFLLDFPKHTSEQYLKILASLGGKLTLTSHPKHFLTILTFNLLIQTFIEC